MGERSEASIGLTSGFEMVTEIYRAVSQDSGRYWKPRHLSWLWFQLDKWLCGKSRAPALTSLICEWLVSGAFERRTVQLSDCRVRGRRERDGATEIQVEP